MGVNYRTSDGTHNELYNTANANSSLVTKLDDNTWPNIETKQTYTQCAAENQHCYCIGEVKYAESEFSTTFYTV